MTRSSRRDDVTEAFRLNENLSLGTDPALRLTHADPKSRESEVLLMTIQA